MINNQDQFIKDKVRDRLTLALRENQGIISSDIAIPEETPASVDTENAASGIVTTQDEIDGFAIIKAIAREVVPVKRITMRDAKSYCAILLDDNNRKPICRLYFNNPERKRIALFTNKQEEMIPIDDLDAIYDFADRIKAAIQEYDNPSADDIEGSAQDVPVIHNNEDAVPEE